MSALTEDRTRVLDNRPTLQYSVGILFPVEEATPVHDEGASTDVGEEVSGAVETTGEVEEDGASVPIAEDWRPSSVAISFITDCPTVKVSLRGGTYSASTMAARRDGRGMGSVSKSFPSSPTGGRTGYRPATFPWRSAPDGVLPGTASS